MCGHKRVWALSCVGTIVSGHKHVRAQTCVGTIVCGHNRVWAQSCVGTIMCGHNHVWAQSCLGTNVCGHNRVWAQSCLGTNVSGHNRVWAQTCLGTIVCGHNRVWAQSCVGTCNRVWAPSCGLNRVGSIMYGPNRVVSVSAVAKALKESVSISTDVIVIFDEIYLQKCEEYFDGETFGVDENGEIFKGMFCFMLVDLKNNTPFIIKCVPEREVNGDFVMNNLKECLQCLHELDFNVRGVVCDNHCSNVSAFRKLLSEYGNYSSDLHITFNSKRIYLFYDSVHLMKSIRNNLLNQKIFLFPPFEFKEFKDRICVPAGEIILQIFHHIHEKDKKLDAHLRAAPKITVSVNHPGSCKQRVPLALAIFDPTTPAAMERYFPADVVAARLLGLFYIWWTVSNSKNKFHSSHRLGNAAVPGDEKPQVLQALVEWIVNWDKIKISSSEEFTLSAQTSNTLQRTLRCHAALIEDLLQEGYNLVLTSRLQSDPIERRLGQYC